MCKMTDVFLGAISLDRDETNISRNRISFNKCVSDQKEQKEVHCEVDIHLNVTVSSESSLSIVPNIKVNSLDNLNVDFGK